MTVTAEMREAWDFTFPTSPNVQPCDRCDNPGAIRHPADRLCRECRTADYDGERDWAETLATFAYPQFLPAPSKRPDPNGWEPDR